MKKTLLLNFVYWQPVGHVIEAVKYAKGFHDANEDLEISVALNSRSPTELTEGCDWIKNTYPIDVNEIQKKGANSPCLKKIPKEWDYIITENRVILKSKSEGVLKLYRAEKSIFKYLQISKALFKARLGEGVLFHKMKLPKGLKYLIGRSVMLKLPKSSLKFAKRYDHTGKRICIMLGGRSAGRKYYVSVNTWINIIQAINNAFPGVRIYLTGVRRSIKGRTNTVGYTESDIRNILKRFDNVVNCYDIGLWNQLALIKQCDMFLSPHTGFGWTTSCVGTPWLVLSGGDWVEDLALFNGLPFYCVLPDDKEYPYLGKKRIKGMGPQNLDRKIPEIVEAAGLLFSKDFTYGKAIKRHLQNLKRANISPDYKKKLLARASKPSW